MTTERAINNGQDFILSGNPEKAMQEMMEAIDSLRTVYTEETDALLAVDTMKFLQLQDRKIEAARNYQSGVEQIMKRKDEFKGAGVEIREELKKKQEEFSMLACANLEALDRMTKTVKRLGDRIMRAARETAEKRTPNYGANGSLNKNKRAVSIGINESA
jgi:hypothetical protein